ncbi:helix-turn-helix domain-containing protein [Salmonella enterica subsp. arizonae]|nr:helix-turn-helix domain-containing protein [Salmonella enterica]ECF6858554.1 helix-turn-helix domain-containing protein [Salmonella enterica subsp. arizonae]ECJ2856716.1 helix-turn-helix domain-containing protein [Salmonella enterica subsp. diarizonae]EDW1774757.1 helix-turn-helix domain-containing protein [Salmonella enterica subsp. diarizonae]EDW1846711.1 helix-turn-helix domain-containing protein [Salmonella enterica subsp. enterica]
MKQSPSRFQRLSSQEIDIRIKHRQEIAVIGALLGIQSDDLGEDIKEWMLQTLAKIKLGFSDSSQTHYIANSSIATRIQLARENLGLTEADLARKLNTYSDHISDWECGTTEPPASMIIPLANALKCDPLWLLTGEITPQASSDNVAQQHHRASQQAGGVSREVLQQ